MSIKNGSVIEGWLNDHYREQIERAEELQKPREAEEEERNRPHLDCIGDVQQLTVLC